MNTFKNLIVTLLLLTLIISCSKEQKIEYPTTIVGREDIRTSITATGTIEPVTKVEVGTQVSGIIDKIYVDYNSEVHRGQIIAELDKTNLLSKLASAQSNLSNAQASYNYQKANYERNKKLYDKGLISANDYEQARLSYEQAQQQVKVMTQNVTEAQTNLGYATITSPIDGIVLSKQVEEGQTVASAMTTPTLFIIAQDLTDMRVIAKIDEADIGGVLEGQRVQFTVDAYPDDIFSGSVTQVRQEATTTSNVVTYEVVISAPNQDLKLKPGLTANVSIFTLERNGVVCIPNKAMRFNPVAELLKKDQKIEDCESRTKVWTFDGTTFKAHAIETGITNGVLTEIKSGIAEGTEIVLDMEIEGAVEPEEKAQNPFMPHPRDKKKK